MDALSQALNNAAQNSRNNNDTLYVENLDDIGVSVESEVGLEPDPNYPPYVVVPKPPDYNPDDVAFKHSEAYKQLLAESKANYKPPEFKEGDYYTNQSQLTLDSLDYKTGELINSVMYLHEKVDAINNTIALAASTMPSDPDLKHRSLHEWDDNYLINELVERENSLMPFYFELLKRIPPDLQPYVQESMNGKYQSLSVLSKLCAALSYGKTQPVPPQTEPEPMYTGPFVTDSYTPQPQPQQSTIPRAPFPTQAPPNHFYRG